MMILAKHILARSKSVSASFFCAALQKLFRSPMLSFLLLSFCFFPFAVSAAAPGSGGPDAFGYTWKDSDEPGGPVFSYLDISSTGTFVSGLADDNFVGAFPIGFDFSFYGNTYTDFYIASNGFIGFGSTSGLSAYTNRNIPNTLVPNNILAWLWDDLILRSDSEVYYQSFSDKLVIQFVQYGSRSFANERVNAEVILYPSGKILFQYQNFTGSWPLTSATVGIENADASDGLEVVYNGAYLHNALAIQFTPANVPPDPPVLLAPANGATNQATTLTLQWNAADSATTYRLQAATDTLFANKVFDDSTITTTAKLIGPLASSKTYYWRVNAKNGLGASAWSPVWQFTTKVDPLAGGPISVKTKSGFRKSNQSKVFYHDSQWWTIAFDELNNKRYIWRYTGANWVTVRDFQNGYGPYYFDAVTNASTNQLYVFGSNSATPNFWRFSYAGGTWNKDAGFPVALPTFKDGDNSNPVSLVQAKNGDLWIFRINNRILEAKRSLDGGQTWPATINVKMNLTTTKGTTDAVAFTNAGSNYLGVAYGEIDSTGSKYGFLLHRDGDPDGTWSDESSLLSFFGNERATNNLSMTADAANDLYLLTRNAGFIGLNPHNTLYKRINGGAWQKYKVTSTLTWKSPAIAVDATNNRLYCMGVNTVSQAAEYKSCVAGQEATLDTAKIFSLFSSPGESFDDLSAPPANATKFSGLLVCGDNVTTNDIWFRELLTSATAAIKIGAVTAASNEVNANATYTIPLTLSNAGALNANTGTINLRFPTNTFVPNTMAASAVFVNGTPATSIISNTTTRQVTIITPVNLSNNQTFPVVLNAGAGLLNPMNAGNYKVTVWTSAQPKQINSPNYALVAATTTVTPATVTLSSIAPNDPADYTLEFNLGNQGRLLSGASTFTIKFSALAQITDGPLSGVSVNAVNASAVGDAANKKITVTLPASLSLGNNAAVTLFFPGSAIVNPNRSGAYTVTVSTSVEATEVTSNIYVLPFIDGLPISNTTKNFDRANQNKLFYHGGFWWVTAQDKNDLKWYLWKFDGSTWTPNVEVHSSAKVRPDCVLEAPNNKVYIALPGGSITYITRLSFVFGNWATDAGYPYTISNFSQNSDYGINLVRALNGSLWVFRIATSTLYAKRSTNAGQTWSSDIIVKSNLNKDIGLTDAVAFSFGGSNYIGVGYAENSTAGSIYGFLKHKDADGNTTWTDETASIPQFSGTTSDDHLSMTAHNNTVLMIVKTNGGGPTTANTGLLRRDPSGNWFQHPILLSNGWTRPTLVVDDSNDELYVFGTRESAPKTGEMKRVPIGDYDSLLTAPIDTLFINQSDDFIDASVSAHAVDSGMNLMICNSNETRNELWYHLITLNGSAKAKGEVVGNSTIGDEENFAGVRVYPNPFNPETFFRFKAPESAAIKLHIFNLNGQLIRTLADDYLPAGMHQRRWNGRNQTGHRVASGIYLYRLQVGEKVWQGRIQMIK